MVKCTPSGRTLCQCLAVIRWPRAYRLSCSTIFGLPEVPLEKYMSMGSAASVSRRVKSSEAARTPVLKSCQPGRLAARTQMPCSPDSASPTSVPSGTIKRPCSSRGVRPPPPEATRMRACTVGACSATLSMTWAMSPASVAMTALMSAPFRRYSRSCSFSMKVAGTITAPSFASARATNQN